MGIPSRAGPGHPRSGVCGVRLPGGQGAGGSRVPLAGGRVPRPPCWLWARASSCVMTRSMAPGPSALGFLRLADCRRLPSDRGGRRPVLRVGDWATLVRRRSAARRPPCARSSRPSRTKTWGRGRSPGARGVERGQGALASGSCPRWPGRPHSHRPPPTARGDAPAERPPVPAHVPAPQSPRSRMPLDLVLASGTYSCLP